jgi:hypothetical protein
LKDEALEKISNFFFEKLIFLNFMRKSEKLKIDFLGEVSKFSMMLFSYFLKEKFKKKW